MTARRNFPWLGLRVMVFLTYAFMLGPILITAAVSFNAASQSKFPPVGFSLRWWNEAFTARWLEPLLFSLKLALLSSLLATALGLALAVAVTRYRFPGSRAMLALSVSPLILPALVTSIGLLQLSNLLGLGELLGLPALLVGHVVICLPFSVRTIAISLAGLPPRVEDAATSLGAPPGRVFVEVVLPLIKSGIFAGATFAFVQSFTDYSVSLFLSSADAQPITITILTFIEFGFTPTLAAVAVITLVVPLLLVLAVQHFFRVGDYIYGGAVRG